MGVKYDRRHDNFCTVYLHATQVAVRQIYQSVHNLRVALYSTDDTGPHFHVVSELHTERQSVW